MLSFLRRLAGRAAGPPGIAPPAGSDWPAPRPDGPVYVMGDVHGCLDAMDRLLGRIEAHAAERGIRSRIVMVGDFVDRGPDAAGVLARARALAPRPGGRHEALLGNHEAMLLGFLDDPAGRGVRWLRFGGRETLESFGLPAPAHDGDLDEIAAAADGLRAAMGDLEGWLRALPRLWRSGDLAVTHAGANPARPIEAQRPGTFVWGHPEFMRAERGDGTWVAHGHVVTTRPYASGGRIGVDTGAVFGGGLTAAFLAPGAPPEFLTES